MCKGLWVWVIASVVSANPTYGEDTRYNITINQSINQSKSPSASEQVMVKPLVDNKMAQIFELSAGGVLSTTSIRDTTQVQVHNPQQSVRLLVRLKDRPLKPHLKQLRAQMGVTTKKMSRLDRQQLAKSGASYQQRLQKSQSQLLGELRQQKVLVKVNHQFTGLTNLLSITATADATDKIRQLPQVEAVFIDNTVTALLADSVPTTGADKLWEMTDSQGLPVTGQGVKVAILDTGIDYTHPDLGGCLGATCKVAGGYNFIEGQDAANPMDKNGHGTHVAGIVAANGTLRGVAPDAILYAYKVLNDYGSGMDSGIIAALEKAVDPDGDPLTDDQVDIINMSLGGMGEADSPLSEAANNAMEAGILVVVAAGNSAGYSSIGSPGNAQQVLTVGAVDNTGAIAYFSSRGPVPRQNYVKPELVAPGVDINSTAPNGGYIRHSGTSMATPHVAGGAALIKQLHPELTATEVKALLIANTKDLGLDVFTQGAGNMDLLAAATANVLITPSLFFPGYVDNSQASWRAPLSLQIKNISAISLPLSYMGFASTPVGLGIELPSTQTSLASGEQISVDFALTADNQLLAYSSLPSMHHETGFHLTAGGKNFRIPVAVIKASRLELSVAVTASSVMAFSDDGNFTYYHHMGCSAEASVLPIDIKPGTYHVVVGYCEPTNALVFKEDIVITGDTALSADSAEAIYSLSLEKITDSSGNDLDLSSLQVTGKDMSWYAPDARIGSGTTYIGGGSINTRISAVSGRFKLGSSLVLERPVGTNERQEYYLVNKLIEGGLAADASLTLDARDSGKVEFKYYNFDNIERGVNFSYAYGQVSALGERYSMQVRSYNSLLQYTPVDIVFYSSISSFKPGEWYPDFYVSKVEQINDFPENITLVQTGMIGFPDSSTYMKHRGPFADQEDSFFHSQDQQLIIDDGAYFLAGRFVYEPFSDQFYAVNTSDIRGLYGLQRDHLQNIFYQPMDYRTLCDEEVIAEGETQGTYLTSILTDKTCNKIAMEMDIPTRFLERSDTSHLVVSLDPKIAEENFSYMVESPYVEQLLFLNGTEMSRVLNSSDPRIKLVVKNWEYGLQPLCDSLTLEYRLEDEGEWTELHLAKSDIGFEANLPLLDGSHWGSLRLKYSNAQGFEVEQTLNSIFVLGTDAKQAVVAPVFGSLDDIELEASGALTKVELPAVYALDRVDGQIRAVTTQSDMFAVGSHQIEWSVTNSVGVSVSAKQLLIIHDTTAPSVIAPADIVMQATDLLTSVNPGVAQAYDLVDGAMPAVSDNSGPFPVGEHLLVWSATDTTGNTGTATQRITITEALPLSSSSAASSSASGMVISSAANGVTSSKASTKNKSGGGGGASSGFLLLLVGLLCVPRLSFRYKLSK